MTSKSKSKTTRPDLKCEKCGREFEGHIATKRCPACKAEAAEKAKPPVEEPVGSEVEAVMEIDPNASASDPGYEKKVHVDPNRSRYQKPKRDASALKDAQARASERDRETKEERERKDPIRHRIEELKEEREKVRARLVEIEEELLTSLGKLSPGQGDTIDKKCFTRYDGADYECQALCPLRLECKERTETKTAVMH